MARSERAAGLIPFIIMLVLFLAALGWGYLNYSAIHKTENGYEARLAKLEYDNKKLVEERVLRREFLREAADTLGYPKSEMVTGEVALDPKAPEDRQVKVKFQADRTVDTEQAKADLKLFVSKWMTEFKVDYGNARFSVEGGEIVSNPDGVKTVEYLTLPGGLVDGLTWRQMPDRVESAMSLMKSHLLALARELNVALEHVREARQSITDIGAQKDGVNEQLRQERDNLRQQFEAERRTVRDTIDRLEARVREAEVEKSQVEEEYSKKEQDFQNRILALEQNIKRLKVKIDIDRAPTADGQVLAASASTGVAVINRGKADNLKPGTVFEVYNFAKGGVKRAKGLIKVLDVYDTSAKCGVLRMAEGDPIVEGDLIANELYNPGKTLHFFILGNLNKYGVTEATAVLERLGNKVDASINVETDYLILGSKANESDPELEDTAEYKKAKELGLKVITESQLEAFTRY